MSESLALTAKLRKDVGKGASRRLHHAELVPAILYGADKKPTNLTFESRHIRRAMEEEKFYSQILTLDIEGTTEQAIVKDIQRHPSKSYAMHMDFLRIDSTHTITTHIPIHFLNEENCAGVKAGGSITHARVDIEIKCLPKNLPEYIEVDMSQIEIGQIIHLSDLQLPTGVELIALQQGEGRDLEIASVHKTRGSLESDEEESETTKENSEKS